MKKRSLGVGVIGTAVIFFGGLFFLLCLLTGFDVPLGVPRSMVMVLRWGVPILMLFGLITGIGLLMLWPWARWVMIIGGVLAVVLRLPTVIILIARGGEVDQWIGITIGLIWWGFCVWYLLRPGVKAQFVKK